MAVCYFNRDYSKKYRCQFEKKDNGILMKIEYDISNEIESIDGVKIFGINTEIDSRDILIIDYEKKANYLLKDAYFFGRYNIYETPDGNEFSSFFSSMYLSTNNYTDFNDFPEIQKISEIKIYSTELNSFIGKPSCSEVNNDKLISITLNRENTKTEIHTDKLNVKDIFIADNWIVEHINNTKINIKFDGYIEYILNNEIEYEDCYQLVYELMIYMQLLIPNKFKIDKISIKINDKFYNIILPLKEIEYKEKHVFPSVNVSIFDFLKECYNKIPYVNGNVDSRNIPYIIMNTSRSIEDNFLMFYRFIENFYKNKGNLDDFIEVSIRNNYKKEINFDIEDFTRECVSLRNHYVHDGYYIPNNELEITYKSLVYKKMEKQGIKVILKTILIRVLILIGFIKEQKLYMI